MQKSVEGIERDAASHRHSSTKTTSPAGNGHPTNGSPAPSRKVAPAQGSRALFARNFFKHPRMLGSLIPSSRFLISRLLQRVDWQQARLIVEYGPGVGTFTTHLLNKMRPDATLAVFETNKDFVDFLRAAYPDPRLKVIHGSAENIRSLASEVGLPHVDYVLSGIPFSTMPEQVRDAILHTTNAVLSPEGAFLVYQFSRAVYPHLQKHFGTIDQEFELLNILPASIFCCRRQTNGHSANGHLPERNGAGRSI